MPEAKTQEKPAVPEKTHYPPCRAACPVNTDVQGYIWNISQGRYGDALDVIRSVNPIASACSLICHHPCEQQCRRCEVDEPLAIRHLKRFALEQATDYRRARRRAVPKTRGKSVGIIGSGPAGLTAANDLADLGYDVTIYEKNPDLGGMLSAAIPTYRLSREALKEDIDDVLAKGVRAVTNCQIGKDVTLAQLKEKHDAVLVAAGLALSRSLNLPGAEGPGVLLALPFLFDAIYQKPMDLGEKVLVVGGGNVAIDVARTARRLGAKSVEMVCLESEEEMPAWEWEVEEAEDEDIRIHHRWGPRAVRRSDSRTEGLEVVRVTSVFDAEGRFNPSFDENETTLIEADTIIISIGQMTDLSFLGDGATRVDERGRLVWDQDTQMSTDPDIFVAGEVVTGPGSAIQAAASGHRAAKALHLHLEGEDVAQGLVAEEHARIEALPPDVTAKVTRRSRKHAELMEPGVRCQSFTQIEIGYDEMTALTEARRCRSCGGGAVVDPDRCMACLTCMRLCPYDAPVVTSVSEISPDRCQACGLCAPECPGRAIRMFGYDIDAIRNGMADIVGDVDAGRKEPLVVAFMCSRHALDRGTPLPDHIRPVPVHCASRLDVLDLLKAFECGADGVAVVLCREGECTHAGVPRRVMQRIGHARDIAGALGRDAACVSTVQATTGHDWRADLMEALKKIPVRT